MNTQQQTVLQNSNIAAILAKQRAAYMESPYPSYKRRMEKLLALKKALLNYQLDFVKALQKDFGSRAKEETLMLEVSPCINQINYTTKRLKK